MKEISTKKNQAGRTSAINLLRFHEEREAGKIKGKRESQHEE